jgi:hypothetical protein
MKKLGFLFLMSFVLSSCSTRQPAIPSDQLAVPEKDSWQPRLEQIPNIDSLELSEDQDSIVDQEGVDATAATESKVMKPPVMGVWIEGAGLESLMALGFLQELYREGVRWDKTMGTGWACWVALSWTFENNPNQAEWQAFKWSSWPGLGMERRLLSRITGARGSFEEFSKELKVWLNKNEYREYAGHVDCPLLDTQTSQLLSSSDRGAYRALWEQLQIPLFGRQPDVESGAQRRLSGLAAPQVHDEEYDRFARVEEDKEVEFWLHLHTTPAKVLSKDDPWLHSIYAREELRTNSWHQTKEGRWVLHLPLFVNSNIDEQKSLNFSERRALMLRGRDLAKQWMQGAWFRNNLAPAFKERTP